MNGVGCVSIYQMGEKQPVLVNQRVRIWIAIIAIAIVVVINAILMRS